MNRTFFPSPPTVGIELEWQLVDTTTLDLRDGVVPLVELVGAEPFVKPELLQTAVETITPPGESTGALRPALLELVGRLVDAAAPLGMTLVGAGLHPFCEREIPVTPLPRYVAMERSYGYLAHAHVTYSLQTHVGMPSGDVAVRVARDLRPFLPVLLALSASSPFFEGHPTTFGSFRQRVLAASRSYGTPPRFDDWAEFLQFLDTVERALVFGSYRDMHWDVRIRPDFGTIEVRIMDAQPTIDGSLALSALVHSLLVHLISTKPADPGCLEVLPWWIEKENAYRASHEGLDALLVCNTEGTVRPLRDVAEGLFDLVAPTAHALGEDDELARARALLEAGPSYLHQLEVVRRTGSLRAVVRDLANELLSEIRRPAIDEPEDAYVEDASGASTRLAAT